jgi:tetratricopeptide (TPR) repeat protein
LRTVCTIGASVCLATGLVVGVKRRRLYGLGLSWFVLGLGPALNVLPVVVQVAERFVYFPSVGLALALGTLVDFLCARLGRRAPYAVAASGIAIAALLGLTIARNLSWRDDLTVAVSQTRCEPRDPNAYWNVGTTAARHRNWPLARAAFEALLAHDAQRTRTLDNLAYVHLQTGHPELAESVSRRSIAVDPRDASAWNNLGASMIDRGLHAKAIAPLEKALEIEPGHQNTARNLGIALFALGRYREAAASFDRAEKTDPDCAECRRWLERSRAAAERPVPPR